MKKSLIALAAIGFVGAAAAQSSVTLYGVADIWVGKPEGGKIQAGSGGVTGSRWGIKGSEDLGGGLKAVFNFEQGIDLGNGATQNFAAGGASGFTRQATVGLEGGFGAVKLGQNWTAFDDIYGSANSGFDSALSASRGVWKNYWAYSNGNTNSNAQIYYATPVIAGFSGALSTKLPGNESAAEKKHVATHIKYENGPIYAGLGYEKDYGPVVLNNFLLNGSYDLGSVKLLGSYYQTKTPNLNNSKVTSYQIGADIPVSAALTVSIGYASSKQTNTASATGFGIAAAYTLSKRTTVYGGLRSTNAAAKSDLWAVGVNHKF
jgi:predicted porin